MKVHDTRLPGVLLIEPDVRGDERGFFMETFSAERYQAIGIPGPFVQDNVSRSARGVLRGLHLQHPHAQGKLVSVLEGSVLDVAVDVRRNSPHFGQWAMEEISLENKRQLWIPPGFAHGFLVTSETALFAYKCTEYYHPAGDMAIQYNDPAIGLPWPDVAMTLSPKDAAARPLATMMARLPDYHG